MSLLRLVDFDIVVEYLPGKDNIPADCLSRAPVSKPELPDAKKAGETSYQVASTVSSATEEADCFFRLEQLKKESATDIRTGV